jgi:hypothetical protein
MHAIAPSVMAAAAFSELPSYQLAKAVLYVVGLIVALALVVVVAVTHKAGAPGLRAFAAVLLRLAALVTAIVAILTIIKHVGDGQLPGEERRTAVIEDMGDG